MESKEENIKQSKNNNNKFLPVTTPKEIKPLLINDLYYSTECLSNIEIISINENEITFKNKDQSVKTMKINDYFIQMEDNSWINKKCSKCHKKQIKKIFLNIA